MSLPKGADLRLITHNLHLKVVAFVLTMTLFVFVTTSDVRQRDFTVRLTVTDVPSGWTLLESPPSVVVTLEGTARAFSTLDRDSLRSLEIGPIEAGQNTWQIRPEDFDLERGLEVVSISPQTVPVRLDERVEVDLPVVINTRGEPAQGYELLSQTVVPETIRVSAPGSYFPDFQSVETETIDLSGLVRSTERRVSLNIQRPHVHYSRDIPIVVRLEVGTVESSRTLVDLPIHPTGTETEGCSVEPDRFRISVSGPQSLVDSMDSSNIYGTIDCDAWSEEGPGTYLVEPALQNVPAAVDVGDRLPQTVTVSIVARSAPFAPWLRPGVEEGSGAAAEPEDE